MTVRHRHFVLCTLAGLGLAGCVSVDPSADYTRAQDLARERAGELTSWPDGRADLADRAFDQPLTPDHAALVALSTNPGLLAQAQSIAAARADVAQAGLLPNPVLGVTIGFPGGGEQNITAFSVSLVQQLAALWTRGDRVAAAEGELDGAILELVDAALDLSARVRIAHARAMNADRVAALTHEHAALLDRLVTVAQHRIDAGEGTRLDLTRIQLVRRTLEAEARAADLERLTARLELLALMGMADAPTEFALAPAPASAEALPDDRAAMDLAAHQRLDVAIADARLRSAVATLGQARGERIPEIEAGVEFSSDDERRQEIGPVIGVEIPIFDTGDAGVAKAAAGARAAEHAARQARQRAFAESRAALARARAADDIAAFTREQMVSLSGENLDLARSAVASGQADTTVLMEAQREVIQANLGLAQAELRAVEARIALARALGGRLTAAPAPAADLSATSPPAPLP